MESGIVIKSTGSWYNVRLNSGEVWQCRIGGKFRLEGLKFTNPVAVGDHVMVNPEKAEETQGVIMQILPRQNYVARQSPRKKHDVHLLASNVDQAMLVTTIVNPMLKQGFIDRFLLTTEPQDIPVIIVFNKADLYSEEDMEIYHGLRIIYESLGYQVLLVSAEANLNLDTLKALLKDKVTLVGGQSGVGKSSLVNKLEPGLDLRVHELSDYSGKGQHTTTFAEMHPLSFGGFIIDTPGIKTLAFNNLEPLDVAHNFRELFEVSDDCRFGGKCLHRNEPGCAVKEAVEEGAISELRYSNYLAILEEVEDQNYWERHKEI